MTVTDMQDDDEREAHEIWAILNRNPGHHCAESCRKNIVVRGNEWRYTGTHIEQKLNQTPTSGSSTDLTAQKQLPLTAGLLIGSAFVAGQAIAELAMGRPPICTCGTVKLWVGDVLGPENSQQLTDWYTFTHLIHGFILYLFLWIVAPRTSFALRFAIAVGLEATWEIIENTPFIIERYRDLAMAQGYSGDSIINSVGDTLAAVIGFVLARKMSVRSTIGIAIALELFLGFMIHDNLTLNVIQLILPNGIVSRWLASGR